MTGIKETEYRILERYYPLDNMNKQFWEFWEHAISQIIFDQKQICEIFLFTKEPDKKRSIGYDIGKVWREGIFSSVQYLITDLSEASLDDIRMLVDTDEFYLGFTLLLLNRPSESGIELLNVLSDESVVFSGVEFFKMGLDGCAFYWYNPASMTFAKERLRKYFDS